MPGKPDKRHRLRIRALDGKPRDQGAINKLKSNQLGMPHLDIVHTNVEIEFIICASKETHIEQVRSRLGGTGFEEIADGDTTVASRPASAQPIRQGSFQQPGTPPQRGGQSQQGGGRQHQQSGGRPSATTNAQPLPGKPYGFVALPQEFTTSEPVWHDGTSSARRLSGEARFELFTLTPLLVGWERQKLVDGEEEWRISHRKVNRAECSSFVQKSARDVYPEAIDTDHLRRQRQQQKIEEDRRKYIDRVQDHIVDVKTQNAGWSIDSKTALCPLRAPWGQRPVIIPGDSLKGLLRHELGALLGAPMERVAERSYSYRPNSLFPKDSKPRLHPRIAWVPEGGVEEWPLDPGNPNGPKIRVPVRLELLPGNLQYDKFKGEKPHTYCFDPPGNQGDRYLGGQGAGEQLNSKKPLHSRMGIITREANEVVDVPREVQAGYVATVRHLVDLEHGHFSERHPDVPKTIAGDAARERILEAAKDEVFQPGDLVWVEWDTQKKCIVSLGWHYYYRWTYTDTVRKQGSTLERRGLFPLDAEKVLDAKGAPQSLSAVRRLFGYTGDNDGSKGIGKGDHSQLMGRVFVNAGLEVVDDNDTDDDRFLPPTFLKELGMPRPSAVEHYLKQPYHPRSRPSDNATLVTYGDAAGYDKPGEIAGRKFYLDRKDAYTGKPWEDNSETNRINDRSTLALEASRSGRRFRFTVRFRDLDPSELAALLVSFCPHQFRELLGGTHKDGYCSKLGYARPLGWGSVQIEAKALLFLDESSDTPALKPEEDLDAWVKNNHQTTAAQHEWLAIHRRNHPSAADYPRARDRDGNENIYTFHTSLRAEHSRKRRYLKDGAP